MTFKSEVEKTNDKGFVGKTSTHLTFALPNPKSNVNLFALPFSVLTIDIQPVHSTNRQTVAGNFKEVISFIRKARFETRVFLR